MPTYGAAGSPAQSTYNYDALVATSVANYRSTLTDNVSTSNIFFKKLKEMGLWESADGGINIVEDLMYGLSPVDAYDSYDELPLTPADGITQAQFDWRQLAAPIAISEKERKQNKHRIVNLLTAKLQQADIAMQEAWAKFFLQGSLAGGGSSLITPYVSSANGASAIDPIFAMIQKDPTASNTIGGINQSTQTWWQNQYKQSAATTTSGYLSEILNLMNTCSKGPGGMPKIAMCDQVSWELLSFAYYSKYLTQVVTVGDYPWPTLKFQNMEVVWDQYMPDVTNTTLTPLTGKGVVIMLNPQFMRVRYESETNFVSTDFQKPVNQDAKFKHILWMGNVTTNNRRKNGVLHNIARTLTVG